jgi:hypothetical protein
MGGGGVNCGGWGRLRETPSCGVYVPHRCCFSLFLGAVSLSFSEGMRVGREEICRHVRAYAAAQWAVHVQV